jgi:hypothetical protein
MSPERAGTCRPDTDIAGSTSGRVQPSSGCSSYVQTEVEAVSAGLGHLEDVYRREKIAQARLLETGQKLE